MDAVIFDFDGVLVDSEPLHERSIREVLESVGVRLDSETFLSRYVGTTDAFCIRDAAEQAHRPLGGGELEALLTRKRERFAAFVAEGAVRAQPGALPLIEELARSLPLGLCSGSHSVAVEPTLAALGLDTAFGSVVTSDRVARSKPDPEGYLKTAAALGVDPARCVVIEDSPTGVRAGKAAGMFVVAVEHSFPAERLGEADTVFGRLAGVTGGDLLEAFAARSARG